MSKVQNMAHRARRAVSGTEAKADPNVIHHADDVAHGVRPGDVAVVDWQIQRRLQGKRDFQEVQRVKAE
jgi:hypothetical protein